MEYTEKDVNLSEILRRVANAQEKSTSLENDQKDKTILSELAVRLLGLVAGMQDKNIFKEIVEIDKELQDILEKYK